MKMRLMTLISIFSAIISITTFTIRNTPRRSYSKSSPEPIPFALWRMFTRIWEEWQNQNLYDINILLTAWSMIFPWRQVWMSVFLGPWRFQRWRWLGPRQRSPTRSPSMPQCRKILSCVQFNSVMCRVQQCCSERIPLRLIRGNTTTPM